MSTVIVLTALDLEYQAVHRYLHEPRVLRHSSGTLFEAGHLGGAAGTVVLTVTGEGNVGAAVLAERAIATFRPQALLCVGIAGGLKNDIALGDVVVATKIYALHGGRVQGDSFLARPRAWPAPHHLEQLARHAARTGSWTGSLTPDPVRGPPAVHFKPIVSGEVVLGTTSAPLAGRLRSVYNDAVAVEMESAGVAQAAHLNRSLPVLSVRGISDHADAVKHVHDTLGWRLIAARHAAAFTIMISVLALHGDLPPLPADWTPALPSVAAGDHRS